jgi:protein-S-isoprenylcysteine O-methyltransferase Ste14
MPWLAVALLTIFLVVVFPVRSAIRRRRFGSSGSPDWRAGRPRRWLVADALFLSGFALLIAGPVLEGVGAVDPLVQSNSAATAIGVVLVATATVLAVWAQETMGSAWRPDIPPAAAATLVMSGPFGVVRNPNYVAMLAAGLGAVILAPNLVTVAAWVVSLGSLMLTARVEEPLLADRYGAAYRRYSARVGRFVPGVGRLAPPPADFPDPEAELG